MLSEAQDVAKVVVTLCFVRVEDHCRLKCLDRVYNKSSEISEMSGYYKCVCKCVLHVKIFVVAIDHFDGLNNL